VILPLDAFVAKCFRDLLYSGRPGPFPLVLNAAQETAVWEDIIRRADGDLLLQPHATAVAAKEAFQLATAWRVPAGRPTPAATEDCEAFARWTTGFLDRLRGRNWLDSARLMDVVREHIAGGDITPPARILLAGFDELTPQQREFVNALQGRAQDSGPGQLGLFAPALREVAECDRPSFGARPVLVSARDREHELDAAAAWARARLLANPRAQIGIIVPDLASRRAAVTRVFGDILQPGPFAAGPKSYHISAGPALAEYPIIRAALLILDAGRGPLSVADAGLLLRSTFLQGGIEEREHRARLDIQLRNGKLRVDGLPELVRPLRALEMAARELPERQLPSAWSRSFARLLGAAGWPGDRQPNSIEYQLLSAWNEALSTLSTLDVVRPPLDYHDSESQLRRIAESTTFQPENEGAPVQIMGTLEAAGLAFDNVWIAGLDEETLPERARPNPFLPLGVQIQKRMPHCSPEREVSFARQTLARLAASAPDVVLSFPEKIDDRDLHASPLAAELEPDIVALHAPVRPPTAASVEKLEDEAAPPLEAPNTPGGAAVLKAMAACPFQAFVAHRLRARGLEEREFGISAMEKGKSVHTAMELIWNELGSQAGLLGCTPDQISEVVRRSLASAIDGADVFSAIERERLEIIIVDWLQHIERQRPPFTIEACERKQQVEIGGLQLEVRVDRTDRLSNGRVAIIDYKTGKVDTKGWLGDRPGEPQLPLYAATCADPLAALLIAHINREDPGYRGLAEENTLQLKRMQTATGVLAVERQQWTRVLTILAEDFRAGVARVDPAKGACQYCAYRALCRVDESVPETPE